MTTIIQEIANPEISVILPVYNGGNYLQESVASVLGQKFANFELLIVDDLSTDNSYGYLQSLNDPRVKIFRNDKNKGLFFNLNFLIKNSSGALLKLWAQDDIMYPHCLGTFAEFHAKHPDVGFSYCGRDKIDEEGRMKNYDPEDNTPTIVSSELHARIAYFTGSITGNIANVCIKKSALNEVGLFDEHMKFSADFDMCVRLAKDHPTGFIREKLMQLRDHDGQLSRKESLYINNIREDFLIYRKLNDYVGEKLKKEGRGLLRKYKLPFYYTLMLKAFLKADIKTGIAFMKEISTFDNFFLVTAAYFKGKFSKPSKPAFLG